MKKISIRRCASERAADWPAIAMGTNHQASNPAGVRVLNRPATLALPLVLIWILPTTLPTPISLTMPTLYGYDCSSPTNIREYSPNRMADCPARQGTVEKLPPREYQLLQREEFTTIPAVVCQRRFSKLEYHCGAYDHSATSLETTKLDRPHLFNAQECWSLSKGEKYVPALARHLKGVSIPELTEVEVDYFVNGEDHLADSQVRCSNSWNVEQGIELVTRRYERIFWENHSLLWTRADGSLVDIARNQHLGNCGATEGFCIVGDMTYVWHNPLLEETLRCPLAYFRQTNASEFWDTHMDGQRNVTTRHLVSQVNDRAHFRIQIQGVRNECSRQILTTQHPQLYVLPLGVQPTDTAAWGRPLERELPIDNLDLSLEIVTMAEYIYHRLTTQATEEFDRVLEAECEMKKSKLLTDHVLEAIVPGLLAQTYKNGTFAARAGEVSYLYNCEKVPVRPVEVSTCYDKLPVTIVGVNRILELQGLHHLNLTDKGAPTLFLTPGSRVLTPIATEVACTNLLPAKYKGNAGWFTSTPLIMPASQPDPLPVDARTPEEIFEKENLGTGAIYKTGAIAALQRRLFLPQVKEAFTFKLAGQLDHYRADSDQPLGLSSLFTDAQDFVQEAATTSIFGPLKAMFYTFGVYAGACIGFFYLYSLVKWIISLVSGVYLQYQARGRVGWHMLWGLPPLQNAFLHRFYRNHRRRRDRPRDGPPDEELLVERDIVEEPPDVPPRNPPPTYLDVVRDPAPIIRAGAPSKGLGSTVSPTKPPPPSPTTVAPPSPPPSPKPLSAPMYPELSKPPARGFTLPRLSSGLQRHSDTEPLFATIRRAPRPVTCPLPEPQVTLTATQASYSAIPMDPTDPETETTTPDKEDSGRLQTSP